RHGELASTKATAAEMKSASPAMDWFFMNRSSGLSRVSIWSFRIKDPKGRIRIGLHRSHSELAVFCAVSELDQHAEGQPQDQAQPGILRQRKHNVPADHDVQDGDQRYKGLVVVARRIGHSLAEDHHFDAHLEEGK